MKKLIILSMLTAFFVSSAQAMIWADPYATVGFGTMTSSDTTNDSESANLGYGLGVRAGMDFMMFFAGVDLSYKTGTYKNTVNSDGTEVADPTTFDSTQLTAGLIAGVSVPVLPIRGWIGYDLINTYTISEYSATNDITYRGSTLKIGAGFKMIPFIQIWAEYQMQTFTEYEIEGSDPVEPADSVKNNIIALGVSIPLSI